MWRTVPDMNLGLTDFRALCKIQGYSGNIVTKMIKHLVFFYNKLEHRKKFTCTDLDPGKKESDPGRDLELKKERETFFLTGTKPLNELKSRLFTEILGQIKKFKILTEHHSKDTLL
jgi:hypothetical protein